MPTINWAEGARVEAVAAMVQDALKDRAQVWYENFLNCVMIMRPDGETITIGPGDNVGGDTWCGQIDYENNTQAGTDGLDTYVEDGAPMAVIVAGILALPELEPWLARTGLVSPNGTRIAGVLEYAPITRYVRGFTFDADDAEFHPVLSDDIDPGIDVNDSKQWDEDEVWVVDEHGAHFRLAECRRMTLEDRKRLDAEEHARTEATLKARADAEVGHAHGAQ